MVKGLDLPYTQESEVSLTLQFLLCIPTYNEHENVLPLVEEIFSRVGNNWDIVFIDDGSPDGTAQVVKEIQKSNGRVHLIERGEKLGLGTAYVAAFKWGLAKNYDVFVEMDADFSHDPVYLQEFERAFAKNKYAFAVGSRYCLGGGVENWEYSRLLLSQLGSLYSTFWLRHKVSDWTGGFNAWSRKCLESINIDSVSSKGYAFQIELKFRALSFAFQMKEVPIVFKERRKGQSKMNGSIVKEALLGVVRLAWKWQRGELFK